MREESKLRASNNDLMDPHWKPDEPTKEDSDKSQWICVSKKFVADMEEENKELKKELNEILHKASGMEAFYEGTTKENKKLKFENDELKMRIGSVIPYGDLVVKFLIENDELRTALTKALPLLKTYKDPVWVEAAEVVERALGDK